MAEDCGGVLQGLLDRVCALHGSGEVREALQLTRQVFFFCSFFLDCQSLVIPVLDLWFRMLTYADACAPPPRQVATRCDMHASVVMPLAAMLRQVSYEVYLLF